MERFFKILKFIGIGILKFINHFCRRVISIVFNFIVVLICNIIWLVTWQPHAWKKTTTRKAKRIRTLTKLKLYAWKYGSWFFKWIHDDYLEKLYKQYHFLIEK